MLHCRNIMRDFLNIIQRHTRGSLIFKQEEVCKG